MSDDEAKFWKVVGQALHDVSSGAVWMQNLKSLPAGPHADAARAIHDAIDRCHEECGQVREAMRVWTRDGKRPPSPTFPINKSK